MSGGILTKKDVFDILYSDLMPLKTLLILEQAGISICFFVLVRYSKKIINRNNYILKLEENVKVISGI